MLKVKGLDKNVVINIKCNPVEDHISSLKYTNNDWGTVAFIIPRKELMEHFTDLELRYNCIYFLIGYNPVEQIYVGQARKRNNGESVLARLREHSKDTTERYYDIWDYAVVCTGKGDTWTLDDLNALSSAFYNEIPAINKLNINTPSYGGADYSKYADKVRQIKNYIVSMGFKIFKDNEDTKKIKITSELRGRALIEDLQSGFARIPEIVTPDNVVKQMVDMLPKDVWNDKTVFIDLACKGGEYLREIYDRLMDSELLQMKYPDEFERSNHILEKQVYGIALSQVSLERTIKKLRGYKHNIKIIPDYIYKLKDGENSIKDIIEKEFNSMEFDVVIGNPPYQEATRSIYQLFIGMGIKLQPKYLSMIVKNNWLTSDTLKSTRNDLIKYGLKDIVNYSVSGEVFPSIGVAVSIFNVEKGYTGSTHIIDIKKNEIVNDINVRLQGMPAIVMNEIEYGIIDKILSMGEESFGKEVYPTEAFRITSVMGVGRGDNSYILDFEEERTEEFNVGVLCRGDNGIQHYVWMRACDVPNRIELVNQYKVVATALYSYSDNPITGIKGLGLGYICSSTFAPIYSNSDKVKAYGAYTYIKTKFFRYLVRLLCSSARTHHSEARFKLVPMQDFSKTWTDEELYKKYNLTKEEIAHIETTIKAIE